MPTGLRVSPCHFWPPAGPSQMLLASVYALSGPSHPVHAPRAPVDLRDNYMVQNHPLHHAHSSQMLSIISPFRPWLQPLWQGLPHGHFTHFGYSSVCFLGLSASLKSFTPRATPRYSLPTCIPHQALCLHKLVPGTMSHSNRFLTLPLSVLQALGSIWATVPWSPGCCAVAAHFQVLATERAGRRQPAGAWLG